MNELNQEEISRNRAERSNRALRNLSIGASALVGVGLLFDAITPAMGVFYITGLGVLGISAQRNLRKLQTSSDQQ
jgi:hypothetical protein